MMLHDYAAGQIPISYLEIESREPIRGLALITLKRCQSRHSITVVGLPLQIIQCIHHYYLLQNPITVIPV
jgi:hypothetical protein